MAATDLVCSNAMLKIVAQGVVTFLNKYGALALYKNQVPPDPANDFNSFQECFFGGYQRQLLTNAFETPLRGADGEYVSACPDFRFECTAGPKQTVFGWYITDGKIVMLSSPLLVPILVDVGTVFTIAVVTQTWATQVLP